MNIHAVILKRSIEGWEIIEADNLGVFCISQQESLDEAIENYRWFMEQDYVSHTFLFI